MARKIYLTRGPHGFASRASRSAPAPEAASVELATEYGFAWGAERLPPWSMDKLFAAGEAGGWWDPSDLSTMFQDSAGTVPVAQHGDPVGRINDKSGKGQHLVQAFSSARPTFGTDGALRWVQFNGSTQFLRAAAPISVGAPGFDQCVAYDTLGDPTGIFFTTLPGSTKGFSWHQPGGVIGAPVFPLNSQGIWVDGLQAAATGSVLASVVYSAVNGRHVDRLRYGVAGSPSLDFQFGNGTDAGQWLSGRLFGMVIRANLTTEEIPRVEAWLARKSGVTLLS